MKKLFTIRHEKEKPTGWTIETISGIVAVILEFVDVIHHW